MLLATPGIALLDTNDQSGTPLFRSNPELHISIAGSDL
jgi:hypothetical protein